MAWVSTGRWATLRKRRLVELLALKRHQTCTNVRTPVRIGRLLYMERTVVLFYFRRRV